MKRNSWLLTYVSLLILIGAACAPLAPVRLEVIVTPTRGPAGAAEAPAEPVAEATEEVVVEEVTVEPTVEAPLEATVEVTVEPTVEVTMEPTVEVVEPTAEATAEPVDEEMVEATEEAEAADEEMVEATEEAEAADEEMVEATEEAEAADEEMVEATEEAEPEGEAPEIIFPADNADVIRGELTLIGTGEPAAALEVLDDDEVLEDVTVGDDGEWTYTFEPAVGTYQFSVRLLDSDAEPGDVVDVEVFNPDDDYDCESNPGIARGDNYIVGTCDTLGTISEQLEIEFEDLSAANPQVDDPNLIYPGQELALP